MWQEKCSYVQDNKVYIRLKILIQYNFVYYIFVSRNFTLSAFMSRWEKTKFKIKYYKIKFCGSKILFTKYQRRM